MSETESKATTKSSKATKATDETKKRKAKTVAPTAACTFHIFLSRCFFSPFAAKFELGCSI
jgi:hypothetical protein